MSSVVVGASGPDINLPSTSGLNSRGALNIHEETSDDETIACGQVTKGIFDILFPLDLFFMSNHFFCKLFQYITFFKFIF